MNEDIILDSAALESIINNVTGEAQLLTVYSRIDTSSVSTLTSAVEFVDKQDMINDVISKLKDLIVKDMADIADSENLLIQSEYSLASDFGSSMGEC